MCMYKHRNKSIERASSEQDLNDICYEDKKSYS